jgi:hypothetical protein
VFRINSSRRLFLVVENLLIFVADSLRLDNVPESVAGEGEVVPTLAPSLHTPVALPSILGSVSPSNHSVRGFDQVFSGHETVFDRFGEGSYYDFEDDPVRKRVLSELPESKELKDLKPPFVFVERAMETHTPYNQMHHGNELKRMNDGYYTRSMSRDELKDEYCKGVEGAGEHFWGHVEELEERGLRDDTMVVLTSDHGEHLGERVNLRERRAHSHPMSRKLVRVPTVFLDQEPGIDAMRSVDIVETCLQMMGREGLRCDGVDAREISPRDGEVVCNGYSSYKTKWTYQGSWEPASELSLRLQNLREDLRVLMNGSLGWCPFPMPGAYSGNGELEGVDF